jgi:site-specific DNA-cytosine methylase
MDDPMKVCIKMEPPVCYSQQAYDEFIENKIGCTLKARGGTYGGGSETLITEVPITKSAAYGFDPGASRDVGKLFIEECGKTLTNGTCPGHHDGVVISNKPHYIVRRLTPTECARLQGFADRWGDIDTYKDFTDEEYKFWLEVRKTYDAINGRAEKDYTKKQILTWYNKLQADSAEYKMWGNGIALPTALYVLQGVAEALSWSEFME